MAEQKKAPGGTPPVSNELSYDGQPVGYKHPPKRTQFQTGQKKPDGSGRKKDQKNNKDIARSVMASPVQVQENGEKRTMSTAEAVLRKARANALSSPQILEQIRFLDLIAKMDPEFVSIPGVRPSDWTMPGDEFL